MVIKKLKNKIVIFVVGVILIVGLLSAYFVSSYAKGALITSKKEEVTVEMSNVSKQISDFFVQQYDFLETIANQDIIINAFEQGGDLQQNKELMSFLNGIVSKGLKGNILIFDLSGNVVASSNEIFLNNNFSYRDYFINGLEKDFAMEIVVGAVTNKRMLVFSHSVRSEDGRLIGLIAENISIDVVDDLLMNTAESSESFNHVHMLIDDNAVVIKATNTEYENKVITKVEDSFIDELEASKRYGGIELGTLQYDDLFKAIKNKIDIAVYEIFDKEDDENEIIGISRVGAFPFYIAIELREINYLEALYDIYYNVIVSILVIGVVSLIFVYYFVNRFLKPLRQLQNAAEKIGQNNFDFLLSIKSGDELEELAGAFNDMSQSLLKSKHDIEVKVQQQTNDILEKQIDLENQKKAALNILEDVAFEKERSDAILRFLKSIGDGVIATDLNNKIIFFNEAVEKMIGVSVQKAMGAEISSIVSVFLEKDEKFKKNVILNIITNEKKYLDPFKHYILKGKKKNKISLSINVSYIMDSENNKQGHIIVLRDVTEERNIEKTKDEFLSVAAHQLRTPLTGIRWSLEMLSDGDMGKLSKNAKQLVDQILDNNKRLILLVNDLLDVSRINMGKKMEDATDVGVIANIKEAVQTLDGLIKERKIKVVFQKRCTADPLVKIGDRRFFQSIENLISNSIKYTGEDGKVIITTDCVEGPEVVISISDNGIGIPDKDKKFIFTKFYRASNAATKDTEGSGLGLNVVKSFIEEAGGRVWFESKQGKGTTFFIALPISGYIE